MRKWIFLCLILFFIISVSVHAEQQTLLQGVIEESGWYGGPVLKLGSINNYISAFLGYRGAWVMNRSFSVGGGGYFLVSDVYFSGNKLNMGYGGLEVGYIINPDALVHFTVGSLIGGGGVELMSVGQEAFFALEPRVGLELNITKFFRLNAGASYRLVSGITHVTGLSDAALSGFTGEIALNFGFSGVAGSGKKITETRELAEFDSIKFRGNGKINLSQGSVQSVTITADDNIIDELKTDVRHGVLTISADKWVMNESDVEYDIVVTDIREISVSGMGKVKSIDTLRVEELGLRLSGIGDISISVEAEVLNSKISGAGDLKLDGKVRHHEIEISGAGELDAYDLITESAILDISGAGDCKIHVTGELTVDISGAGDVKYKGDPRVIIEHLSMAASLTARD
ncbi:MAG: DUF2807 domain-containing protein [Spirochaetota bacterium]|nr:MAG: DUF2807 domain-containing protein [Spirochaetota bacterium]